MGLAAAGLLAACTEHASLLFPTTANLPEGPRRPDGVAVDLTSEPPPLTDVANVADGVATLRTPLGGEVALVTIRGFFAAMVREDLGAMASLTSPAALVRDTNSATSFRVQNLVQLWRERFQKFDYTELASALVFREADVMTYRPEHLTSLPTNTQQAFAGETMAPTDLVLRVPIITPNVQNERVLGNELVFWLSRQQDRYVVMRIAEVIPM